MAAVSNNGGTIHSENITEDTVSNSGSRFFQIIVEPTSARKEAVTHSNVLKINTIKFDEFFAPIVNATAGGNYSFIYQETDKQYNIFAGEYHNNIGAQKVGNTISVANNMDFLDIDRFSAIRLIGHGDNQFSAFKNTISLPTITGTKNFDAISIESDHTVEKGDTGKQYFYVINNSVNLSGATDVSERISGVHIHFSGDKTWHSDFDIKDNTITLSNLKNAGSVFGIHSFVEGFQPPFLSAISINNDLTLSNSEAKEVAGTAFDHQVKTHSYTLKDNDLKILNSTVEKNAAGIYARIEENVPVDVANNHVYLVDSTVGGGLFGLTTNMSDTASVNDGIDADNQITAQGINKVGFLAGFKTLNLVADNRNYSQDQVDGSKAVITLTGTNVNVDLNNRELKLSPAQGSSIADSGFYNLIYVEGEGSSLTIQSGTSITYEDTFKETAWKIVSDDNSDLTYETGETFAITFKKDEGGNPGGGEGTLPLPPSEEKPTDNTKTLAENFLGSAALIGLGTEYIANEGLSMIVDSAKHPGTNTFGAIYGGTSKYHTGSRLDLDSATLITGISGMTEKQTMAISAFVEAGWGDSEGHVNQAHAKADHNVYSMGTAMRIFTESPLYFDASWRLGVAHFDYKGQFATESVKFDHSGIYAALHGAVGYAYPLSEDLTLDSYLRYSFTYLEGGKEALNNRGQNTFDMDAIRASAFRVGTRLKGYVGEQQSLNYRVGLAYEKVVDGDANTKLDGMTIDTPSLNGDTGILEVGIGKRPTKDSPWGADLTLKGYAGDHDGLYGSATLNYVF